MVRLTDRPGMTLDVYLGRKTTMQQQQQMYHKHLRINIFLATGKEQKDDVYHPHFLQPLYVSNGLLTNDNSEFNTSLIVSKPFMHAF